MLHGMEGSTMATSSLLHNQDCTLRVQRRLKPDSNHLAAMSQYRLPKRTVDTTHSGNKSPVRAFSCNEFFHYCSRCHDTNTKQMHITTNPYYGIHIAFTGQSEEGKQTFEKLQIKRGGISSFHVGCASHSYRYVNIVPDQKHYTTSYYILATLKHTLG